MATAYPINWNIPLVRSIVAWGLLTTIAMAAPLIGADPLIPPEVSARAVVLMNPSSNQILYAKEPHLRLPPASTTKVLTALIALEHLNLNTKVPAGSRVLNVEPSRIGLQPGDVVYAQDLLYGLLLKSGNDAAETIAEAIGGSVPGFAQIMNARAWRIGARDTHFVNPHGLPDDRHYTTAYDLALIFRYAMNNPTFAEIVRTHDATLRIESPQVGSSNTDARLVSVHNTNRLLASYEGARGGKTGFTRAARNCFVGEASRGEIRLVVAVLGSAGKVAVWQDVRALLDYGFALYGLTSADKTVAAPSVSPTPLALQGNQGE